MRCVARIGSSGAEGAEHGRRPPRGTGAGARSSRARARAAGKGCATRSAGASSRSSDRTARPGARWRSPSRSQSSAARRRRVRPTAPIPSSGGSKAALASTRSGRRRGTIGRGSWPRASAWSRSPAVPNWAPTAERGRSASCAIAVSPNSTNRWRVAGSAGSRPSGRSRSASRRSMRVERGRRLRALEARQPRGERRQPPVLADPAPHLERCHATDQHHRPGRDPSLRPPHRSQAGHVHERHADIDRLHPRREVVERVEHAFEGTRIGLRHAQLGPDQGKQPGHVRRSPPAAPAVPRSPRPIAAPPASATSGSRRRPSPNHRSSSAEPPASAQRCRSTLACTRWPTRSRPIPSQAVRWSATRTPATTPATARPAGASTSAEVDAGSSEERGEPIQRAPIGHRPLAEVEDEGIDEARTPEPGGQLDRLGGVVWSHDEQPFEVHPEARGHGRVEGAVEIEPGGQAAGRLCGGQGAERQRRGTASDGGVEHGQRATRPAIGPQRGIERRVAGRDRRSGPLQRRRLAPATQPQPPFAERLEGGRQGWRNGGIGPHRTTHDRTDVLSGKGYTRRRPWGCSSAGRAPRSHRGGQGFESPHLHHPFSEDGPRGAWPRTWRSVAAVSRRSSHR